MSDPESDARTVEVITEFAEAIDREVVQEIGYGMFRGYEWVGDEDDDDDSWPFVVIKDGREYEVDIQIFATELTPEVKARRAAEIERIQAMLAERGITP